MLRAARSDRNTDTPSISANVVVYAFRREARFHDLVDDDRGITGNLTPGAYLATLALTHGCRLATADRGFRRFPGLLRPQKVIDASQA